MLITQSPKPHDEVLLLHLAQVHENFRLPEIKSLLRIAGCNETTTLREDEYDENVPRLTLAVPRDDSVRTAVLCALSRAVLLKEIYEQWATGDSLDSLGAALELYCASASAANTLYKREFENAKTFRFNFHCFRRAMDMDERARVIDRLSFVCPPREESRAQLRGPADIEFGVLVYRVSDTKTHWHFGVRVGEGGRLAATKLSLKKRRYLGTTSMDAEIALAMANQGLAAPDRLVYDPFVGSGSILVACAHFGATVFGSDIDSRVLRGQKRGIKAGSQGNVMANFEQYGLTSQLACLGVIDALRHPWQLSRGALFDAIVTDPPYGVRAGVRASENQSDNDSGNVEELIPALMEVASQLLVPGGRLVYMLPQAQPTDENGNHEPMPDPWQTAPEHAQLKLVHVSVQNFGTWSRSLVTYEKLQGTQQIQENVPVTSVLEKESARNAAAAGTFRKHYLRSGAASVNGEKIPQPLLHH